MERNDHNPVPPQITQRLAEFCSASKSGNVQLDIKDGQIVACKLTESLRVIDKGKSIGR